MDDQEQRPRGRTPIKNAERGEQDVVGLEPTACAAPPTFNEELKSTFNGLVANIVQTVDKTVTTPSPSRPSRTSPWSSAEALLSDDEEVIPKIDVAYEIYTDEDLTPESSTCSSPSTSASSRRSSSSAASST